MQSLELDRDMGKPADVLEVDGHATSGTGQETGKDYM